MEAGPSRGEAGPSTSRAGPSSSSGGRNAQAGPSRRQRQPGKRDRTQLRESAGEGGDTTIRSTEPSTKKAKSRRQAPSSQPEARPRVYDLSSPVDALPPSNKKTRKRRAQRQSKEAKTRGRRKEEEGSKEVEGSFEDLDFEILGELGSADEDPSGVKKGKRKATDNQLSEEGHVSTPSAYRPLRRSILAGMKISPDPPSRPPTPPSSSRDIQPEKDHFDPPNLFSATLPINIESSAPPHSKPPDTTDASAPVPTPQGLLLPSHVILDGMDLAPGESSDTQAEDDEGLFFLDEDTTKNVQRYFDPTASESIDAEPTFLATADQSRICKKCKRPGHRAEKCPHVVCDICGVIDDHEKAQCKFGMKCFKCGERGHRREDCRNRPMSGCPLCGSRSHIEMSCPTHWRIYTYRTPQDREVALEEKENLAEWQREAAGGAEDQQWCYNCAREGHFGDDCNMRRGSVLPLETPSPFSYEISSRGPFSNPGPSRGGAKGGGGSGNHTRFQDDLPDLRPEFAGLGAGQKGKQKAREEIRRAERAAQATDGFEGEDDDDPIWLYGGDQHPQGSGRGGKSTPMRFPLPPRPWDSERRERTPQSGSRGMPFSHGHLMSSAPRGGGGGPSETHWNARPNGHGEGPRGKGISFGKISLPSNAQSGVLDTPSGGSFAPGPGKWSRGGGRGGAAATLVSRALGNSHNTPSRGASASRSASPLGNGTHTHTGRHSPLPNSTPLAGAGKKKRKSGQVENEWSDGRLGGNVADWGREMDGAEREGRSAKHQKRSSTPPNGGLKIKGASGTGAEGKAKAPKSPKSSKGKGRGSVATAQKYYGGY